MASTEHMTLAQLCNRTEALLEVMYRHTPDDMQWVFDDLDCKRAFMVVTLYQEGLVKPTPKARELVEKLYQATDTKREEIVAKVAGKRQADRENT